MAVAASAVECPYEGVRMLPWLLFLEVTGGGLSVQEERRESLHHLLEEVGSREHHLELEGNKNFVKGEVDKVEEEEEKEMEGEEKEEEEGGGRGGGEEE